MALCCTCLRRHAKRAEACVVDENVKVVFLFGKCSRCCACRIEVVEIEGEEYEFAIALRLCYY